MKVIKSIIAIVKQNFRKWVVNPRYYILLVFVLTNYWHQMDGMLEQAKEIGAGMNAFSLFPVLYSNSLGMGRLILNAGVLLLFCDAPFIDRNQQFVITRSGKKIFGMAQILYIVCGAAIYTLVLAICPCIFTYGYVGISEDWGTLMRTVELSNVPILGNIGVRRRMLELYSAKEAFLLQSALFFLIAVVLGLVVYLFNLLFQRMAGIIVAGILMLLGVLPYYFPFQLQWVYWISPVSFAEIHHLDFTGSTVYPPVWYAFTFLSIGILVLSGAILFAIGKTKLIVREEL